ncbi:carbohydrate-binding protein [Corallococcus sp. CA054B]|uniref:cellulase family glycosylhydrolase n=1 Tax=Corallococcus sp. CA054B TaxID=2316734 RepID=UPI000E9FFA00|nr:carbohydrate-binding domain-containing protein [Corallococcus sp. CA054B]RKG71780.1 carbohydrate-binding protein [Corallococcus sp. CA054B]
MNHRPAWTSLASLLLLAGCAPEDTPAPEQPSTQVQSLAVPVPARIQAEDYKTGGEGVGYHDTTAGNSGGVYRAGDVDLEATSDVGGGYNVTSIAAGEWLGYTIQVTQAGTYSFKARVASGVTGTKTLHLIIDGYTRPAVSFTQATGAQSWMTVPLGSFTLGANIHSVQVVADTAGFNFNHLDIALDTGVRGMGVDGKQLVRDGKPFLPRGFNMVGVLAPDGCANPSNVPRNARNAFGQAELLAARDAWAANTVRFQVSQAGLDPQDPLFRQSYVDRVKAGVQLARSLGLVVIVSMQDQFYSCGDVHPLPSAATLRAWSTLVPELKADPDVMLELFNEPQNDVTTAAWEQWKNGGTTPLSNLGVPAVGYQQLVNHVRALGSTQVLIADGANYAGKLQGMPLLTDTLVPPRLMYAVHPYYFHIANNATLAADQANWETRFGYLTATHPVIATEWNANSSTCKTGTEARIPDFFAWLKEHRIGLLGHAFDVPGSMVNDLVSWQPTTLTQGCSAPGNDAGTLVQAHFRQLAAAESP